MAGRLKLMDWPSVTGWVAEGGAKLGTKRAPPQEDQLPQIAQKLKEFGIQALLIIGGFEVTLYFICFSLVELLNEERSSAYIFVIRVIRPVSCFSKREISTRNSGFLLL